MTGVVTNLILGGARPSFLPIPPGKLNVRDERFIKDKNPVFSFVYKLPGDGWLDDTQVVERPEYIKQLNFQRRQIPLIKLAIGTSSNVPKPVNKTVMWGILGMATLGFIMLAWMTLRRTTDKKTN